MPLEDKLPVIDNRRYDDIVREARTRIARYTPEWTDFNDNDPGMALVQLFAWMTDMMLFRLGQVPALNYIKFLQLLGIELRAAEPARAEIFFPVQPETTEPFVIVPLRAKVSAPAADGGPPVIFETERSLVALTAELRAVQAFDGYAFSDVTRSNTEPGQGFEPFGSLANPDSALYLGFGYPATSKLTDFPQVELNLAFLAHAENLKRAVTACSVQQTQVFAPAKLAWETWNGKEWQSVALLKDETNALTQSGHIYLKTPPKGDMARLKLGQVNDTLFWIRGRLETSGYDRPPKLLAVRTNTVAAIQAETARDEILGGSDASPNQTFRLSNTPVLDKTLRLEVDEGDGTGYRVWDRVDDFFASKPDSRHYLLDRVTGEVRFGDGTNGAIPVANVANATANIVAREYRFGGGKGGNVGPDKLKTLLVTVTGLNESGITNLQAAAGGQDEETLEAAKLRASQSLKSQNRAITAEDYELLAKQAATIKRAKALPLFHPDFPGVKVPGVVTLIVIPDTDEVAPSPSEATRRTVCAYLQPRRALTAELYVIKPTYQQVSVRVEVFAADSADLAEVTEQIEQKLLIYFHPLKGGEDGQGWPFGGTIYYSRVYQQVFTVPGVQSIEHLILSVDGEEALECANVPLAENALAYSTQHEVKANYATGEPQ